MKPSYLNLSLNYRELISSLSKEFNNRFAALASPTISKQETVTFLYNSIQDGVQQNKKSPAFPWKNIFQFIPKLTLMFARCCYASLRFRVNNLPEGAIYFRTWLVPRSLLKDQLQDDYFRQLPIELENHETIIVGFTSLDFGLMNQFARIAKKNNQILSYGLLSLSDICKLFFDYLKNALIQTRSKYELDGQDVTKYINYSLLLDYLGLRSFDAFAEKYKCQRLIKNKIKAFVYIFENQSWEKVCCHELRKHNIKLIGYQSSGFSPVFLNFFPTVYDSLNDPMPDTILTVGENFKKYLLEEAHYNVRIETFAALRFSYPVESGQYRVSPFNRKILGRILYAFSVHLDQYHEIIKDLTEVFGKSAIHIDLKIHPLYRLEKIEETLDLPDNFSLISQIDVFALRDTYDCVLFNDNSFGIEALLHGVKSYQYNRRGHFADDRFFYFNFWNTQYKYDDLYRLRDQLLGGNYIKSFDEKKIASYVNTMYRPYSSQAFNEFMTILTSNKQTRITNH